MIEAITQKGFVAASILALGALLGVILKSVLPYRMSMIETLSKRVELLEGALKTEQAARAAEVSLLRHENNNLATALDLFVELIEAQPNRAREHAVKIKARRAHDADRMSTEKAIIRAATIHAASGKEVKQSEIDK